MELTAVNHWPVAVETHQLNHPTARHYVEDLDKADPEAIVPEGYLDLLMASPECRFYSRARGGKPVKDQGRMNPWIVQRWLTALNIRCLLVENVPEFIQWGPLLENGKPDKSKKGMYFQEWVRSMWGLGYKVEWRTLNAADFGDATTRIRFFLQARNDGKPITWPEPTHAKEATSGLMGSRIKWKGAQEIIDWSDTGKSLLDDPKYKKKQLSEKTRRRIAKGFERYGGPLAPLYIRLLDLPEFPEKQPDKEAETAKYAFILNQHGDNGTARIHSLESPCPTITTRGAGYVIVPEAKPFVGANRNGNIPKSMEEPVPPATTANGGGSFIVQPTSEPFMLGQQSGAAPRTTENPTPTIASAGAISLVRATIIEYYGWSTARDIVKPLSTVTSMRKHAIAEPTLYRYEEKSHREHLPHKQTSVSKAIIVQTSQTGGNGYYVRPTEKPVPVITTRNDVNIATPILEKYDEKVETQSAIDKDHILHQVIKDGIEPKRLIFIDDIPYLLDIRFRMLQNPELARAMGFEDEESSYEFVGNVTQVTKQIGNAVPVKTAAALVKSALQDSIHDYTISCV